MTTYKMSQAEIDAQRRRDKERSMHSIKINKISNGVLISQVEGETVACRSVDEALAHLSGILAPLFQYGIDVVGE